MRAIDADALSEWLKDYGQKVIKGERKISLMYVWKHIQDMQTIEERKTGEWITQEFGSWAECSECHELYDIPIANSNFCPNCGADMRGEPDETD